MGCGLSASLVQETPGAPLLALSWPAGNSSPHGKWPVRQHGPRGCVWFLVGFAACLLLRKRKRPRVRSEKHQASGPFDPPRWPFAQSGRTPALTPADHAGRHMAPRSAWCVPSAHLAGCLGCLSLRSISVGKRQRLERRRRPRHLHRAATDTWVSEPGAGCVVCAPTVGVPFSIADGAL